MTPDMKRLCEAVIKAQCENNDWIDDPTEAIVRAVLTALRQIAEESPRFVVWTAPVDQAQLVTLTATMVRGGKIEAVADKPIVAAMIDHILSEPATA